MSLLDSIYGHQTGTYVVTRRPRGVFVNGIYVPSASPTTLTIRGVIQPAREIQRVTAGRDMRENEQNQHVDDVRIIHTDTELHSRTPTLDPDTIAFESDTWYVIRVERWQFSGIEFWMAVLTREMDGGS